VVTELTDLRNEAADAARPAGEGEPERAGEPLRRRVGVLLAVAAVVYALDLASKLLVVANLSDSGPIRLLGGLLTLRLVRNPGAAFGIGVDMTVVFTGVAALVIVVILRLARRLYSLPWALALGMLLGGAFGNLTDRVFRSPGWFSGHVVDFLELPHWPVFNLADSAIVTASVLMVTLSFRGLHPDGTVERARRPPHQDEPESRPDAPAPTRPETQTGAEPGE
jgi:signal peptidase II